jgi:hypothetical protein
MTWLSAPYPSAMAIAAACSWHSTSTSSAQYSLRRAVEQAGLAANLICTEKMKEQKTQKELQASVVRSCT